MNPVISTYSDRYRSRFGRRIPFLFFATPFVTAALVLMAFSPEIGAWLHVALRPLLGNLPAWSLAGAGVFAIALLMGIFKFFDMFINTVFWYFFNDVVPNAYMARFLGLFRVVGSLAGMLFNWFLFPVALTHFRWIFLGAAVLYFAGFMMMCWRVKEGKYPPPARMGPRLLQQVR